MDLGALEVVAAAFCDGEQRLEEMAESPFDFAVSAARLAVPPLNLIAWHIRCAAEHDSELYHAFQLYEKIATRALTRLAELDHRV